MGILRMLLAFLRAFFASRAALAVENLALRQQLIVLQLSVKRPQILKRDRIFWSWLSRPWSGWRSALLIVQPVRIRSGLPKRMISIAFCLAFMPGCLVR